MQAAVPFRPCMPLPSTPDAAQHAHSIPSGSPWWGWVQGLGVAGYRAGAPVCPPSSSARIGVCVARRVQEAHITALGEQEVAKHVIATKYIDECLLNAMCATAINRINQGDYRQVCGRTRKRACSPNPKHPSQCR